MSRTNFLIAGYSQEDYRKVLSVLKTRPARSYFAINSTLEILGDVWPLCIVRNMVYFGKKTYGEFLD
jgi:hypothetical protein